MSEKTHLKVLIVDDEPHFIDAVGKVLIKAGHKVVNARTLDAVKRFSQEELKTIDLAVLDWKLPEKVTGFMVEQWLKALNPDMMFMMITGHGGNPELNQSIRNDFVGFLRKPFTSNEVAQAFDHPRINQCLRYKEIVQSEAFVIDSDTSLVGKSVSAQKLRKVIEDAAKTDATVLIRGESGTGKELVAMALHNNSLRKGKPFAAYNVAALPASLIETELFGYVKGAFTGAAKDTPGRIVDANGGTLLLDEIGDMPLELQPRLLRVLQERVVVPVGSSKEKPVDIRIIAATHQNLEQKITDKEFRQDLYYRLNVIPIEVVPLRVRTEDIIPLIEYLYEKARKKYSHLNVNFSEISEETKALLLNCEWPGNIRQLSNIVERAAIFGWGYHEVVNELEKHQLASEATKAKTSLPSGSAPQEEVEKIDNVRLEKCRIKLDEWEKAVEGLIQIDLTTLGNAINKSGQSIGAYIRSYKNEFIYLLTKCPENWTRIRNLRNLNELLDSAQKGAKVISRSS